MTQDWKTLELSVRGHVAEVKLNRPDKGNAVSPTMFAELEQVFAHIEEDAQVRVALLYGEGKAFSYGLDLMEAMSELAPHVRGGLAGPRVELRKLILRLQRQCGAPASCSKPVVVAVHGWCIGAGLDILSACDVRLCSQDARFSLREARMGIVADIGSLQRLPRIIGDAATRELALTAKDIDAARAERMGLVSQVLPDRDALLEAARQEAEGIAALPPLVVQGVKHVLEQQDGMTIAQGLEYVATWNSAFLASEDLSEAFTAFFEKRDPDYKGR